MSEIASRVKAIIVDKLGVDENQVTETAVSPPTSAQIALTLWSLSWNLRKSSALQFPMTRLKVSQPLAMLSLISKQLRPKSN